MIIKQKSRVIIKWRQKHLPGNNQNTTFFKIILFLYCLLNELNLILYLKWTIVTFANCDYLAEIPKTYNMANAVNNMIIRINMFQPNNILAKIYFIRNDTRLFNLKIIKYNHFINFKIVWNYTVGKYCKNNYFSSMKWLWAKM